MEGWHNRGYAWGKVASEWAGQTSTDKKDFVTFAPRSGEHATAHRSRIGDNKKPSKDRDDLRQEEPLDTSIHTRTKRTKDQRFSCAEIATCQENGLTDTQTYRGEVDHILKLLHS